MPRLCTSSASCQSTQRLPRSPLTKKEKVSMQVSACYIRMQISWRKVFKSSGKEIKKVLSLEAALSLLTRKEMQILIFMLQGNAFNQVFQNVFTQGVSRLS